MATRRLTRRTVIAILVAVAVLVVVAIVLAVTLFRPASAAKIESGSPTAAPTGLPASSPTGAPPAARPLVVYVGNSFVGGSAEDSGANDRFPALVSQALGTDWQTITADGAGYVTRGAGNLDFADLAGQVPGDATLVVIVGSDDDAGYSEERIMDAALNTLQIIRQRAPAAQILVASTPWVSAEPPAGIVTSRDAVLAAAAMDALPSVDPIADGWWVTGPAGQIGDDGLHPTDLGHDQAAEKLEPIIQALLNVPNT